MLIKRYARAAGRDPDKLTFAVSPGIGSLIDMDLVRRFEDVGIHQVIAGGIPKDLRQTKAEIERLAEALVVRSANV